MTNLVSAKAECELTAVEAQLKARIEALGPRLKREGLKLDIAIEPPASDSTGNVESVSGTVDIIATFHDKPLGRFGVDVTVQRLKPEAELSISYHGYGFDEQDASQLSTQHSKLKDTLDDVLSCLWRHCR